MFTFVVLPVKGLLFASEMVCEIVICRVVLYTVRVF